MKEQIEQLRLSLTHEVAVLEDANPLDLFKAGEQESLRLVVSRLEAILAQSRPENGLECLQTPNTGTFDEGYDAGFQAALKEMRNV